MSTYLLNTQILSFSPIAFGSGIDFDIDIVIRNSELKKKTKMKKIPEKKESNVFLLILNLRSIWILCHKIVHPNKQFKSPTELRHIEFHHLPLTLFHAISFVGLISIERWNCVKIDFCYINAYTLHQPASQPVNIQFFFVAEIVCRPIHWYCFWHK